MTELNIAAPLAAALAAKGYASLTAVQEAVLASEAEGRDMLVSAQTGSGKTVAFGLAVAPDILQGEDRVTPVDAPLGLAIAPTRELALQVARELAWLYGEAGVQIATCVGGMDYRNERRALERGPHIVVGTPGRLRDHIDRGGLNLSQLRAAVLDEADEMLDLGFREDLEFILEAAPAERRTLMFSATVPPAIEKLARDFQKDALRIVAQGEARQHGDIEYRAYSVLPRDREPAIFNLLRLHESRTSIIFCKTRANVNHLLARMGNRGFKVVALSGELSQAERSHALQALRDGRAQVCIATDVAARGIDLPGLELVIHADLPTNSETLLHRSGRTGRAGSKGVSALIVTSSDYKKAQRLLKMAKLEAEWSGAPSADEVRAKDDERLMADPALTEPAGEDSALTAELLNRFGAEQVAAAFVRMWREGRPAPEELTVMQEKPAPSAPREPRDFGESVWFSLTVGYSGRAEARWLLPKICEAGQVTKDVIGAIKVREHESFVQIAAGAADKFGEATELEDGLMMIRQQGMPNFERAAASPRREPAVKKGYPKKKFEGEGYREERREPRAERSYEPRPERSFERRDDRPRQDDGAVTRKARWSTGEKAAKRPTEGFAPREKAKFAKPAGAKPAGAKAGWAKPAPKRKADGPSKGFAPKRKG
ncbi:MULTISPECIES: DEAD/DEAH box helicase [Paracoccus]|uniref:DEAD/DEAH box helicase n=1 Tax=Paracoccus litorisediminis TaxID=2006130 RepID=A0A844HJ44_9RHOB|nr:MULTISPECIES: DEAD/DEAH box helicase [Paracoccus]MBD9527417.1 DEAD/DEAH box helicase [Paracoccus sp. PAR01]MTH60183.1 DEAD/DEAH box helicase [Paracoccus litorisediminis]